MELLERFKRERFTSAKADTWDQARLAVVSDGVSSSSSAAQASEAAVAAFRDAALAALVRGDELAASARQAADAARKRPSSFSPTSPARRAISAPSRGRQSETRLAPDQRRSARP
jgi:hypothetical protein